VQLRRTVVGLALLVALAGCTTSGYVQQYEATPATVSADALVTTGYERATTETQTRTRKVYDRADSWENAGSRNVTVVETTVLYTRDRTGSLAVLASPGRRAHNDTTPRTAAPTALVGRVRAPFGDRLPAVENRSRTGTYEVSTLDTTSNVTTFAADRAGDAVTVHVVRVADGGDIVVAVAVVPDGQRRTVDTLFENVTHGP
jgi:hypothetical protein